MSNPQRQLNPIRTQPLSEGKTGIISGNMGHIGAIDKNPTGNCQLSVYRQAANLFVWLRPGYNISIEEVKTAMLEVARLANKTSLLIDINQNYVEDVKKIFEKNEIQLEANYRNNTGSQMCIMILHISKFTNRVNREREAAKSRPVTTTTTVVAADISASTPTVRISPRTGRPVRQYTRRGATRVI